MSLQVSLRRALDKMKGVSEIRLSGEQEHGVRNAVQIVDSSYRVLLSRPDMSIRSYYQLRAEEFRMLAKNLELIATPRCLLVLADAYDRLAEDKPMNVIVIPDKAEY